MKDRAEDAESRVAEQATVIEQQTALLTELYHYQNRLPRDCVMRLSAALSPAPAQAAEPDDTAYYWKQAAHRAENAQRKAEARVAELEKTLSETEEERARHENNAMVDEADLRALQSRVDKAVKLLACCSNGSVGWLALEVLRGE
jgi:uncharacterized coiled-coil protein SlyX